jgi:DNA-binding CsgD family transcriptional regulator
MDHTRATETGWDLSPDVLAQEGSDPIALSGAELEILRLSARWMTDQEIARELACTAHAVQAHLSAILAKLDVGSRTEAVLYGLKKGWLP